MDALLTDFSWPAFWAIFVGLEFWGAVTGAVCVWLCVKERIENFPVGIVNVIIFFFMFWNFKLYASAVLQVFFLGLCIWGWYVWATGSKNTKEVRVTRNVTLKETLVALAVGATGTYFFGNYLATVDDPAPYTDAGIAVFSVISQYFMSKKVFQCWYLWISIDVIAIYVYSTSGLLITAALYFMFLCMCVKGIYDWKNEPAYKKLSAGEIPTAS
jgi:nicotinamide mononucleotide transporter